jgi:hypothetical protein
MKRPNDDNKYVISAGLISFGISFSIILMLDYLFPTGFEGGYLLSIFSGFIVYILSSGFAGFLLTYKSQEQQMINSLKASFFAFMINALIMLFLGTLYGIIWIFMGYGLGGMIGGILGKTYSARTRIITENKK